MSKFELNSGFLILYDWLPGLKNLSHEQVGRLVLALIDRQKNGTPIPNFEDSWVDALAEMIEPVIKRRLIGQSGAVASQKNNRTGTPAQNSAGDRTTQIREEKKREDELSPPPTPSEGEFAAAAAGFDEFYREYPKHSFKANARSEYFKHIRSDDDHRRLMELLAMWKKSDLWKSEKGRWIKRCDRFISESFADWDVPETKDEGSFDTDEFFSAAMQRAIEYLGDTGPESP